MRHYIRIEVVEALILDTIKQVSGYARTNEAEFIERVRNESVLQQETAVKDNKKLLTKAKRRRDEVSTLVKKLFETYGLGKIPENHFTDLLKGYDSEQTTLDGEIISRLVIPTTGRLRLHKIILIILRYFEYWFYECRLNFLSNSMLLHLGQ